jgi:hypothetical protein
MLSPSDERRNPPRSPCESARTSCSERADHDLRQGLLSALFGPKRTLGEGAAKV